MASFEDEIDGLQWEEWENCMDILDNGDNEASNNETGDGHPGGVDGLPDQAHLDVLQTYFGHSSFRPIQWEIIQSVLKGHRDNCVILATGYGKSLIYQYPSVFMQGLSVVVSPLISLMQDQVLSLKMNNIPACFLGSAQTERNQVMQEVYAGRMRIMYVTPEFLMHNNYGIELLQDLSKKLTLSLIAIDEAHCVSQWGHDFRADYRKLGSMRDALPNVPFLAVTATATPSVRQDICASLHLKNPSIICSSFDRPNLYFSVSSKSSDMYADLRKFMVKESDRNFKFDGPTIIYCQTRKSTEDVYSTLKNHGILSDFYHAKRKASDRVNVHEKFVRDELPVIVATVAFGMGIDKPDVRNVIHWGAPKDIESYYQEVGRAGRDGLPAKCHVYYSPRDFVINHSFLASLTGKFLEHRQEMCKVMERYLDSTACRRQSLLMHFEGKNFVSKNTELKENCCDNCSAIIRRKRSKKPNEEDSHDLYDFTDDANLLLSTVQAFSGKVGVTRVILCIRGSTQSHLFNKVKDAELHGKGKEKSEDWWKALKSLLAREGYLESAYPQFQHGLKGFPHPVLVLTKRGENLLSDLQFKKAATKVMLPPGAELLKLINIAKKRKEASQRGSNSNSSAPESNTTELILPSLQNSNGNKTQNSLHLYLLRVRKDRALEMQCAPFHLASNQALLDMSACRPSSVAFLKGVDGFTDVKIQRDGLFWITHITKFCQANGLMMDNTSSRSSHQASESKLSPSVRETYDKFQKQKLSLEQLVLERKLARGTIISHLCSALKLGLPLDLPRAGVHDVTQELITKVIRSPPINSNIAKVKPIKEKCPENISYDQIHLVVAHLTGLYLSKKEEDMDCSQISNKEYKSSKITFDDEDKTTLSQPNGFTSCSKALQSQNTLNVMWQSKSSTGNLIEMGQASQSSNSMSDSSGAPSNLKGNSNFLNRELETNKNVKSSNVHDAVQLCKSDIKTKDEIDEILHASEINWDDEFSSNISGDEDLQPVVDQSYESGVTEDRKPDMTSLEVLKPETLNAEIKRSSSGHLQPTESCESDLKRSISLDHVSPSNSQCSSLPKRKMPEWLTKANAQAEVRKRMKKNSLFKL